MKVVIEEYGISVLMFVIGGAILAALAGALNLITGGY